jgi:3-methyladenine DNA glycosylase AlkC
MIDHNRKGARRRADITPAVQRKLDSGEWPTASLSEALAVDFVKLIKSVAPQVPATARRALDPQLGITQRMKIAGGLLLDAYGPAAFAQFAAHPSDTVRGWAAYALAHDPQPTLAARLKAIRLLADDAHFGVREWAWIALRPAIARDLPNAIVRLQPWTASRRDNLRRFAVEITRPRGVWCSHINELKRNPEPALVLLSPLRADEAKYVQDSVANWLNDASKSQPDWVREVCREWLAASDTAATRRICRRALRTIDGG